MEGLVPWLIVGLGNPGPKYSANRHNIGFMVADELVRRLGATFQDKFEGRVARGRLAGVDVLVLEPQTFMNLSGAALGAAASYFKIAPEHVIVIHDELDLPFEQVRVKVGGGHAGHNGLRSVFQHFGADFVRVRCGIGRPVQSDVVSYVLSDFSVTERETLGAFVDEAAEAVELIVSRGALEAMNVIHPRQKRKGTMAE
ncbi:MAG: aminoacyl-tRNA hydrolase [Deltaproteobacteria bacterium HGW-Deltaproteobacteria-14]|nr:MAG: aminoacyl-tRNA hydrolase [Deltaproteobacteria bacterium HGW-Deltaproteobacteria-14]